jgi:hypothetical protein
MPSSPLTAQVFVLPSTQRLQTLPFEGQGVADRRYEQHLPSKGGWHIAIPELTRAAGFQLARRHRIASRRGISDFGASGRSRQSLNLTTAKPAATAACT